MTLIEKAIRAYWHGGLSILPINPRTKRPASWLLPQARNEAGQPLFWQELPGNRWITTTEDTGKPKGTWEPYQLRKPTAEEIDTWLRSGVRSVAAIGGIVSDGVEILDFDNHHGATWYQEWANLAGDPVSHYGLPLQKTGGLGYQVAWRCEQVESNQKLAWIAAPEEASGRKAIIETRGEGGYALLPPSAHPSGRQYQLLHGRFSQIPVIEPSTRDHLLACARQLSQVAAPGPKAKSDNRNTYSESGANAVVEAYNQKYSIEVTLQRYGYTEGGGGRWSRPGKADSLGVTVYPNGKAYAFSSNDVMAGDRCGEGDNRPFTSFDLFAYYEHGQDYKAATKAAATELGMSIELHTLLYVEGHDNAAAVRDVMFHQGWVTRGFTPNRIKLDGIERYQNIIVWAYTDRVTKKITAQIPGAFPVVAPKGLDAQIMAKEGILQPYLEAVLVDTRGTKPEVATWTL